MDDIKKLIETTTIVKVHCYSMQKDYYGEDYISRFQRDQGKQIIIADFDPKWKNKFSSFNSKWNEERQKYRFLYDSFELFWLSFNQLRRNKIQSINSKNSADLVLRTKIVGLHLTGVYQYGKKCIDLITEKGLNLLKSGNDNSAFCCKYSETRNKIIQHNNDPRGLNLLIDPSIWSLASTNSLLEAHIHKPDSERVFDVYVDYYEDYYKLEQILADVISVF